MKRPNFVLWLGIGLVAGNLLLLAPSIIRLTTGILVFTDKELRSQFEPDFEGNLFTWYSSVLLAGAAFMALINFWLDGKRPDVSSWRFAWLGVFMVMILLSAEEVAQFHEAVQSYVQSHAAEWAGPEGESLYWLGHVGKAWLLPYSLAIVAVIVFFLLAFKRIFQGCAGARTLALGGLCLWMTVLILEFFIFEIGTWGRRYAILEVVFEEGLEMFGSTAMLIALVWRARESLGRLCIRMRDEQT